LAAGVFLSGDPCELLEGWVVEKPKRSPPNAATTCLIGDAIRSILPAPWRLREECAVTLIDSEPEPAFAVVPGPARRYLAGHPTPTDITLIGEVADTSLREDRAIKGRIYARAGIPAYWIINVVDRQVEVYTDPTGDVPAPEYRQHQNYLPGSAVPLTIGGQAV